MRIPALTFAALLAAGSTALAATPAPAPRPQRTPVRIDIGKITPKQVFPKEKLHTEFVVEVNKLGQVTRVRSGKSCPDLRFNAQTYGNALQSYIRTPDGRAISGLYRLTYDYDPQTQRVRRDVSLVRVGGVDPNAEGAAIQMMKLAAKQHAAPHPGKQAAAPEPRPAPSVDAARLPDLPQVMQTPRP
ncbi:MAG TPA: hypothetical protein VMA36_11035 [Candidatus Limnocylindria bacterium]|jgi:hypothetical protein|nr:hypothetical protein [Candidatus Limnocylindria bacterium]